MKKAENSFKSDRWFAVFCVCMLVLLLVNVFVVKLAIVEGNSMYPTLHHRQLLVVYRLGYVPETGDVIVIHTGKTLFSRDNIVKRLIASAGETVEINYHDNTVSVDGVVLAEPYLNFEEADPMLPRGEHGVVRYTVPEGQVFVMGDNRNHSADSRSDKYGMIDQEQIVGRVILPKLA